MRKNIVIVVLTTFLLIMTINTYVSCQDNVVKQAKYIDTHNHIDVFIRKSGAQNQRPNNKGRFPKNRIRPGLYPSRGPGAQMNRNNAGGRSNMPKVVGKDTKNAVKNIIKEMNLYNIDKSIIVVVPSHAEKNLENDLKNNKEAVSYNPDRLLLAAGGATLGDMLRNTEPDAVTPEIRSKFRQKAIKLAQSGIKGFGEMLILHLCLSQRHAYFYTPADHPLFFELADIAAQYNLPVDMHMEASPEQMQMPANLKVACSKNPEILESSIPGFERLLAHNRNTKIIWQHLGWDNIGYYSPALVRSLLKKHPNLYFGLKVEDRPFQVGFRKPMPNRLIDMRGNLKGEWLQLFKEFPDRFVIGSDEFFGVSDDANRIGRPSFSETWSMFNQLPPDLKQKIGYENPRKIYNIR